MPTSTSAGHVKQATVATPTASVPAAFDMVQVFHDDELVGNNQDTLPILVQDGSGEPISLIANIDLDVTENYMSQAMLTKLGLSSTTPVPTSAQHNVLLGQGNNTLRFTAQWKTSLNLLAGPSTRLKQFANVEFHVFELPPSPATGDDWEPELFLGMAFLRAAGALTLSADFSGQGVVDGVPVLVRDMSFVDKTGREVDANGHPVNAKVVRDEL